MQLPEGLANFFQWLEALRTSNENFGRNSTNLIALIVVIKENNTVTAGGIIYCSFCTLWEFLDIHYSLRELFLSRYENRIPVLGTNAP